MKELTLDQLVSIQGGDADLIGFVDGFCTGVGIASIFTGVGLPLGLSCGGWIVIRLF